MRNLTFFVVIGALLLAAGACGSSEPVAADPLAAPTTTNLDDRQAQARAEGLELKQFDLNRDDQPDVFKFYRLVEDPKNPGNKLERLVRKELDLTHDGKIVDEQVAELVGA